MSGPTVTSIVATKRAVIFDLFHTLTTRESTMGGQHPATHALLGVDRQAWNHQLLEQSRPRLIGENTDAFSIIAGMARAINPAISDDDVRRAARIRAARFAAVLTGITPETHRVLQTLRNNGHKIGLISNADVMEVAAWAQSPIAGLFDSTIFSCHVGYAKPEPEIYRRSLDALGIAPADAIFVGDGGSNELEGAKRLGIATIMITGVIREIWPDKIAANRSHADFVIEELSELVAADRQARPVVR